MQLRDHRVCGLELHLQRLARDSRGLFGREVDCERLLAYPRSATRSGPSDLSAQVNVFFTIAAHGRGAPPVTPASAVAGSGS